MSTAGGYHKAVLRAEAAACDCVQVHLISPRQWPQTRRGAQGKPSATEGSGRTAGGRLDRAVVEKFKATLDASTVDFPLSHASYLINLAAPDQELWKKSIDAFVIELQCASALDIPFVVLHPGAYTTSSERYGIKAIVKALNEIHRQTQDVKTRCLLENTAGQGSTLGYRFEQLAEMIDGVQHPERLGVCFDTCHAFAAGYPLADTADYSATMHDFDQVLGVQQIKAFHLNDSKKELASRVDRHEHIGQGCLGEGAFANLLRDERFHEIPMYLETPKGKDDKGRDFDVLNLQVLRRLAS